MLPIRQRTLRPLTEAQKILFKMRTQRAREDAQLLQKAVTDVHNYCKMKADEIARQFNKKPDYVHQLIHSAAIFKPTRKPNIFNALVHQKAKEINAGA